jgi:hypothetical protein
MQENSTASIMTLIIRTPLSALRESSVDYSLRVLIAGIPI